MWNRSMSTSRSSRVGARSRSSKAAQRSRSGGGHGAGVGNAATDVADANGETVSMVSEKDR